MNERYLAIYKQVQAIPKGKVATYGQIGYLTGLGRAARQVGRAMAILEKGYRLEGETIPWHRVVNSKGEISPRANPDGVIIQRMLLEEEGIEFLLHGRLSLKHYQWLG